MPMYTLPEGMILPKSTENASPTPARVNTAPRQESSRGMMYTALVISRKRRPSSRKTMGLFSLFQSTRMITPKMVAKRDPIRELQPGRKMEMRIVNTSAPKAVTKVFIPIFLKLRTCSLK